MAPTPKTIASVFYKANEIQASESCDASVRRLSTRPYPPATPPQFSSDYSES